MHVSHISSIDIWFRSQIIRELFPHLNSTIFSILGDRRLGGDPRDNLFSPTESSLPLNGCDSPPRVWRPHSPPTQSPPGPCRPDASPLRANFQTCKRSKSPRWSSPESVKLCLGPKSKHRFLRYSGDRDDFAVSVFHIPNVVCFSHEY